MMNRFGALAFTLTLAIAFVVIARVWYAFGVCDMARDSGHLVFGYSTCVRAVIAQGDDE